MVKQARGVQTRAHKSVEPGNVDREEKKQKSHETNMREETNNEEDKISISLSQ